MRPNLSKDLALNLGPRKGNSWALQGMFRKKESQKENPAFVGAQPYFGACCLDVRTLPFSQLMGFPLDH